MVRFSGKARKTNHLSFIASEVCLHPESLRESYGLNNYDFFTFFFTKNLFFTKITYLCRRKTKCSLYSSLLNNVFIESKVK
ncbi:MAG: hypothetical protein U5L45_15200 [Saprospiraceae bacterium]|nr:hypothetical protein [Saprospiraceae bacterium]